MSTRPVTKQVRRVATEPATGLGRLASFLHARARLWQYCAKRLSENNLMAMSAALSFRTIFALVPTLVLVFVVAKSLGGLEDSKVSLRRFLDTFGFALLAAQEAPSADAGAVNKVINVAEQIETLVGEVERKLTVERVGPVGAALFIWTALGLLTTVEQSLNRVFHAAQSRSVVRRTLLYWSVMTLGPVALTAAVYVGRQALHSFEGVPVLSWLVAGLGRAAPLVVGILALAAVYILMPNTAVHRRAAFGAAVVAVLLWLAAKLAFSWYVKRFVVEGNLYGILGLLPLFLLWLNLSWLIFLFGAELARTAADIRQIWECEEPELTFVSPSDALAVTIAVARTFHAGGGPLSADGIAAQVRLPGDGVQWLLDRLAERDVICAINGRAEPRYVLARAPAALKVIEILELGERHAKQQVSARTEDPTVIAAQVESRMRATVGALTVADLLAEETGSGAQV